MAKWDRAWQRGAVTSLGKWLEGERWNDEPSTILFQNTVSTRFSNAPPEEEKQTADKAEYIDLLLRIQQRSRLENAALLEAKKKEGVIFMKSTRGDWPDAKRQ